MGKVKSKTPTKYFLVTVWNDIEPECEGPFKTEDERDQRAKDFREEEGDRHGIYWLNIKGDKIEIGAYSGGFFEGLPEE